MISIDQYAYINRLKKIHPMEKFILSILSLSICLWSKSWLFHLCVMAFMTFFIVGLAKIPLRAYLKFIFLPFVFLMIGVWGIVLTITKDPSTILYGFKLSSWTIGISHQGVKEAIVIFFRAYACVTCLYFLALTTPMVDVIWVLKKLKVSSVFIELMTIIYRFIFVLMETASMIYISQECRLGYASLKKSYGSLGQLISNLFLKSFYRGKELFTALSARGYNGELKVLDEEYDFSKKNIGMILCLEVVFFTLGILL